MGSTTSISRLYADMAGLTVNDHWPLLVLLAVIVRLSTSVGKLILSLKNTACSFAHLKVLTHKPSLSVEQG